jgi:chromosome segregation ATPase
MSKKMNTKNILVDAEIGADDIASADSNSKLLIFDENNTVTTGKDINEKITSLDADLRQLRNELGIINGSVEEGLDRLSDKDTDLTAKVSETYKRLGEIDNAYKALLKISSRIDNEIQRLNGDVTNVAEQSASGIKNLAESTITQSKEFAEKNQQIVSRVNHLVETSKLTSEMMNQSIHSVTGKMLKIEQDVVAQIENLSSQTKDKTQAIEKTVEHNSANILKLQSVDEAIIRRATALEITAAELTAKGQYLDSSVEQLQIGSDMLSGSLRELSQRTEVLEELTTHHGSLIDGLQKAGADLGNKLAALTAREGKHFKLVAAAFILLLLVTAVIYFMQQDQFSVNATRVAANSENITELQQAQSGAEATTNKSLALLESKIQQANTKIQTVQDQVQSVDGRLNQSLPFSQIGDDNVIHSSQWIAALPQENLTIQLAYADNKDALYEIAQRYRFQLKDSLSYFTVREKGTDKYVLLSGSYTTQQQAISALESMPVYIDRQKPVIRKLKTVQQYIVEQK